MSGITVCPKCGMKVIMKSDGTCPNCRVTPSGGLACEVKAIPDKQEDKRTFGRTSLILGLIPFIPIVILAGISACVENAEAAENYLHLPIGCLVVFAPLISLIGMMYGVFSVFDTIRFGPVLRDLTFGLTGILLGILNIVFVLVCLAMAESPE